MRQLGHPKASSQPKLSTATINEIRMLPRT